MPSRNASRITFGANFFVTATSVNTSPLPARPGSGASDTRFYFFEFISSTVSMILDLQTEMSQS